MDFSEDSEDYCNENKILLQKIDKLKNELKTVQEASKRKFSDDAAVQVIFRTKSMRKYQNRIEFFLKDLLRDEKQQGICFDVLEEPKVPELVVIDDDDEEEEDMNLDLLFFTECTADAQNEATPQILPVYETSIENPLGSDVAASEEPQKKKRSSKFACFNCLGEHHMKDCPEERNGLRIANNRRDMNDTPTPTSSRYHREIQTFDKSKFQPGVISDTLRDALHLRNDQLPLYIYRMRILGYPPGWMKDAELHTGLAMYDSKGNAFVNDKDETSEKKQFDGQKFVSYPGFNTPVPKGVRDDYVELRMPALQNHQQLAEALKHKLVSVVSENRKRKKGKIFNNSQSKADEDNGFLSGATESSLDSPAVDVTTPNWNKKTPNTVHSGSPFIPSGNSCSRVPDISKFAEGMSDFLPYENLPDAVGSYDKMKDVIDNVREKMKHIR